jgi:S1-C subfamily serine protease
MARVAAVAAEAIGYLASTDKRPTPTGQAAGQAPAAAAAGAGSGSRRVSLGAVPSFDYQGPGLKIDGVVPGSPAEKAGMKAGDVLTHMGGDEVKGLGGFNELLKKHQPGDKVELRWTRGTESGSATVELVAR